MAQLNSKFRVSGIITQADGLPYDNAGIELLFVGLREESVIGKTKTNTEGVYQITYTPPAGRAVADIRIRVLDSGGRIIAISAVQYRVPQSATIDLVVPAADALENGTIQLVNRLKATAGNINLADLREDRAFRDISTLSASTGEPPRRIARLSLAHRHAVVSKIAADIHFAWLEAGLPEDLDLLVTLPSEYLKSALENASVKGILDQKDSDYWEKTVQKLKRANIPQPLGLLATSNLYQPVSTIQTAEAEYIKRVLNQNLRRIILENLPEISASTRQRIEARISGTDFWDNPDEELGSVIFRAIAPTPPPDGVQWPPKGIGPDPCKINQMAYSRSKVRDVLQLDSPLQYHPFFAEPLRWVKTFEYAKLVSVTTSKAIALLEQGMHADEWSEDTLQPAVAAQIVTHQEAKKLSRLGTLSRLAGHNPGLVTLLHQNAPDDLTKLVANTPLDWQALIDRNQIPLPPGETPATIAEKLATQIELAYPVPYFLYYRLKREPAGSLLALFHKNNPSDTWLRHDWLQGNHAEFNWTGIAQAKKGAVIQTLAADQRIFRIADTPGQAVALRDKGYDSARSIANQSVQHFVQKSGLSIEAANRVHAHAQEISAQAVQAFAAVQDVVAGGLGQTYVGNISKEMVGQLLQIEGMSKLFGPGQFCDCPDCRSVLSPAAYLVDMLRFVQQYVDENLQPGEAYLSLTGRRPDLKDLPLSCANTNNSIPYLTVVNEVLAKWVADKGDGDVFELAANTNSSKGFLLPFNLPLAELRLYLSHFDLSLFELSNLFSNPSGELENLTDEAWLRHLELDDSEKVVITTPELAKVPERYRIDTVENISPSGLIQSAGINRNDLTDLLKMRFNAALKSVKVILEKDTDVDDIQAYKEVFQGLTNAHADYLYRFIRLWKKTPWTPSELDAVLLSLPTTDKNLEKLETLIQLAKAAWLQKQYSWNVSQLCTFLDKMPTGEKYPQKSETPEERGFLERVFDLEALFGLDANGQYQGTKTVDWTATDAETRRLTALVISGLQLAEPAFKALLSYLDATGTQTVTRDVLSLLYRHTQMARSLGWPLHEWLTAAELLGLKDIKGLSALIKVWDFSQWQQALGLLPSEMAFFQGKTNILDGQDFVFRSIEWMDDLKKAVKEKTGSNDLTPEIWEDVFKTTLPNLQAWLNVGPDFWVDLLEWTPTDIADYWAANSTAEDVLLQWAMEVERVLWLVQRMGWTETVFHWMTEHPSRLKISNRRAKNLVTLQRLAKWQRVLPQTPEEIDLALKSLDTQDDPATPANESYAVLANWWKEDADLLFGMRASLSLSDKPSIPEIWQLKNALATSKQLGASATLLEQLTINDTYENTKAAAAIALQLIKAKYQDEKKRETRVEPMTNQVNAWRRDVLVQYILTRKDDTSYPFEDESSLYAYFLLDVEMDGCFRTSRIVAAHGSIQLYIHRVLMNLEQSADSTISVLGKIEDLEIFKTEWEWRKNYRVWEANRKVFLYPENYLEPDLRDNKTPIFKELEEELLQRELSQESAELAWRNYFTKYTELAELRIAGSFYDKAKNTYHFFGRTSKDPYQYFYRRWENQRLWTPWESMELPILTKEVTGIIHKGQTYVFWAEVETENDAQKVFLNKSFLKSNGRWSTPQRLEYGNTVEGNVNIQVFAAADTVDLIFNLSSGTASMLRAYDPIENTLKETNSVQREQAGTKLILPRHINLVDNTCEIKQMPIAGLSLFATAMAMTESEIDLVQSGLSPSVSAGNFLLTSASGIRKDISHIGNTSNSCTLELGSQQYLAKAVKIPELAHGPVDVPFTTFALPVGQPVVSFSREFFNLVNIGHHPKKNYTVELADKGLQGFLDTPPQAIPESDFPLTITNPAYLHGPQLEKEHMAVKGSYGIYLQELFFHAPFLIAYQMNANQKFKEAKWWYERIFDPAASGDVQDPDRPWRYIEFKNLGYAKMKETLQDAAAQELYRLDPFNPHAIARLRLSAYQKTIVMKYVDNLIDWGDHLFAQYSMESINEALMIYQLAYDILGKRPEQLGACPESEDAAFTYNALEAQNQSNWDDVLVGLEHLTQPDNPVEANPVPNLPNPQNQLDLAFCIPFNLDLLQYWDRVADRLYKIRHCLDINGQRRQLPLFSPPIDPMLLVRAKAMGLSLEQALELLNMPTPRYRFTYLIERAKQYTQMVQSFGSALLSALNSKDAEQLQLLRSVQEREIMRMGREVKKQNLEEAKAQMKVIYETKANIKNRKDHFHDLIAEGLLDSENVQEISLFIANNLFIAESIFRLIGVGWPFGSPKDKASGIADFFRAIGTGFNAISSSFATRAGFVRRKQDWEFQEKSAEQELKQLAQQLLASEIRVAIAEKDLEMHERSMEHSDELYAFYRDKFTNLGLYNFMARTLHTLHRQAYNIAYETALQAQKALEFEREKVDIIRFDNWAVDRAGLLSGERLMLQIQQLERKYEEVNTRELELTKHISLQQLNPIAVLLLRETGKCNINIPEELYDLDFPGHFKRRIKSVSITIPCVAGPYTTINATLRLNNSSTRIKAADKPTLDNIGSTQSIATSSAQGDSGLFELNFRDERYLPFEGAGAISKWSLELMYDEDNPEDAKRLRQFDYNTISDVIMHVRYTAQEDKDLKTKAIANLKTLSAQLGDQPLVRVFNLRHDFPAEFHAWKQNGVLNLDLIENRHFPYLAQGMIGKLTVNLLTNDGTSDWWDKKNYTPLTVPGKSAGKWPVSYAGQFDESKDYYLQVDYKLNK